MPLYQPVSSATALPDGIVEYADLSSAARASLAAASEFTGTYGPIAQVAPGVRLYNPLGLRRWSAALNDAIVGSAVISVYGDSITKGVGSDGSATDSSASTYWAQGWTGQLRSLFAGMYGDPGEGNVGTLEGGSRWTFAGGAVASASTGPSQNGGRVVGNTQTITISLPACTEIDVHQWDGSSGTATYDIDTGGATGNLAAGANQPSSLTWTKTTITGLANTTHSMVITGPAGGTTYVAAVVARKQATGVFVHRFGKSGNTTANIVGQDSVLTGNASGQTRMQAAAALVPAANLLIIALGVNDFTAQNSLATSNAQPGTIPSQYAANLQAVANQAVTNGSCVLLLGEPRQYSGNYPSPMTYTEAEYWAQAKAIALATDHVAFLDLGDLLGTWTQASTIGYQTTNSVHPTRKGHGAMARVVHRALSLPYGMNAPTD